MLRVLIADDHPLFRQGIRRAIEENFEVEVIDEAGTSQEVLEKMQQHLYDLLLLDIGMPNRSGLEILKQLTQDYPNTPILILSIHSEKQYIVRALKAGVSGYLTKSSAGRELVEAIRIVLQGDKYITSSMAKVLAEYVSGDVSEAPHEILTDREFEVMCLIASGIRLKTIAQRLSLSEKTISAHRANILKKMNMSSNAELTRYVVEKGLLE